MKLNNKGITTVEVLICFILVAVITMSLYSVISSFNEKRLEESNKAKILIYKNTLTKKIQDDIVKRGLTYATTTEEVNDFDGKVVTLNMTFKDGTKSVLKVTQLFTKSSLHVDGIKEKNDKFSIYYGKEGNLEEYPLPDLGEYRSYYKEMSDADDCDHSTGICIESCDNDNEECIEAGIAKELQVPVVVLTQLPREVERKNNFRPQLGDLRGYGTTEQDSDVVLYIYRDDYYNKKSIKQNIAEIIVAKNRYGERNKVINLKWDKKNLRFQEHKESKMNKSNIWLDGIMGVVVGDSLGVPVEFKERQELRNDPVVTMRGYGSFNLPAGSWSDDTSMTLATLDSLKKGFNRHDIMRNFISWIRHAEYTPFGNVFDVGNICYTSNFFL